MNGFTKGELEVMQVLWEHGLLKPADIQEHFPRPIRNAALRSVLLVLLEKEHVVRVRKGRAYYYRAKTPRQRTLKKMTRQLAQIFTGGSAAALIVQLIKSERLSDDDIGELKRITNEKTGKNPPIKRRE